MVFVIGAIWSVFPDIDFHLHRERWHGVLRRWGAGKQSGLRLRGVNGLWRRLLRAQHHRPRRQLGGRHRIHLVLLHLLPRGQHQERRFGIGLFLVRIACCRRTRQGWRHFRCHGSRSDSKLQLCRFDFDGSTDRRRRRRLFFSLLIAVVRRGDGGGVHRQSLQPHVLRGTLDDVPIQRTGAEKFHESPASRLVYSPPPFLCKFLLYWFHLSVNCGRFFTCINTNDATHSKPSKFFRKNSDYWHFFRDKFPNE